MKNMYKIIFSFAVLVILSACSEDTLVTELIDDVQKGAVLRNLGETNSLDSAVLSSTYSITLEAQDASNGALLSEVRVNVGFADVDDMGTDSVEISLFRTIPAASFDEVSDNGLPQTTFSATLQELVGHVETSEGNFSVGDAFIIDFEMVLTDGRVFNLSNATNDVTRTGRFSYFNAQFQYVPEIQDPQRVEITELVLGETASGRLGDGQQDTVFVRFSDALISGGLPTVTVISAEGLTGGGIVEALDRYEEDEFQGEEIDENDHIYFLIYEGGDADTDTISFSFSGALSTEGFPSYTDVFENAFIIDNDITASVSFTQVEVENGLIDEVIITFNYGEALVDSTLTYGVSSGEFEDFQLDQSVTAGETTTTLSFRPLDTDGDPIPSQELDISITLTGARDEVGNEIDETINVTLL